MGKLSRRFPAIRRARRLRQRRPEPIVQPPPAPPLELAGNWIAWSEDNRLIGWSESFTELCDSIDAQGIEGASYEYFSGPRRRFR